MSDRTKPHRPTRPGSMSDDDRALIGKRHTPPAVPEPIPVELDTDATPLPNEPPSPEAIEGFEELSPPLKSILRAQHDVLREHDIALGRVWPARHVELHVERLNGAVSKLIEHVEVLRNVPSVLHAQRTAIATLERRSAQLATTTTKIEGTLSAVHAELVELKLEREREAAERRMLEQRVGAELASVRKDLAEAKETNNTQDGRLKSLEDDRTKVRAWAKLLVVLASIASAIGGWLVGKR